jgi:hypothetical protein
MFFPPLIVGRQHVSPLLRSLVARFPTIDFLGGRRSNVDLLERVADQANGIHVAPKAHANCHHGFSGRAQLVKVWEYCRGGVPQIEKTVVRARRRAALKQELSDLSVSRGHVETDTMDDETRWTPPAGRASATAAVGWEQHVIRTGRARSRVNFGACQRHLVDPPPRPYAQPYEVLA